MYFSYATIGQNEKNVRDSFTNIPERRFDMKRKNLLLGSVIVIVMMVVFPSFAASATKTVRIGGLFALSGWFSSFDILQWEEAQLARDMINEDGGIVVKGEHYMIELIAEDFKSTTDGVVAGANKLVYDKNVKFMISPSAFFSGAATDICEPNKVLRGICFILGTPQELGPDTKYAFLCHNASVEHALTAITYLKQAYPKVKKVAFVIPDDGIQDFVFPQIKKLLTERGISVIGDMITYPNEMVDFSPIAAKVVATKADALFMQNGLVPHAGNILKRLREMGSEMPYAASISANVKDIKTIAGEAASTNFFTIGPMIGAPDTPPLMAEILRRLTDKYGTERSIHMQPINVLYIMKQAIEAAQSFDTTVVRDTWEKMETFETPYGIGHLGGLKTYGIKHAVSHPDIIQVLDKGEPKFGAWVDIQVP